MFQRRMFPYKLNQSVVIFSAVLLCGKIDNMQFVTEVFDFIIFDDCEI